jgi:predicted RNA-binding protein with PUA-like domain
MAHWLLKTEPSAYHWDQLAAAKQAVWDGVTNPVAQKHLREARRGDQVVLYHTGDERAAVGLAEVVREAYPDPRAGGKLVVIDIAARKRLPVPVGLATLKAHKAFAQSPLVRQGRLSVVPLTDEQWNVITGLGGLEKATAR